MPLRARARALGAALLALAGVLAVAPPVSAAPEGVAASGSLRGAEYVALGDSYAAGYGLPDPTGKPIPACGQSSRDYPHRVAERLGLRLTDVSCATATTADVRRRSPAGAPAQLEALGPSTRVVTLTIGGNDSGLFSQAFTCLALTRTGPVIAGTDAASCRSQLVRNGVDSLRRTVEGTIAADLATTIRAVRRAAPNAALVLVGYPTIFPDAAHTPSGGCFRPAITGSFLTGTYPENAFPFTDVDVAYFAGVQAALDATTARVAREAGVPYVSMLAASAAHSPCATRGAWVNGMHFRSPEDVQQVDLDPGALHPNEAGAAALADAAASGIQQAVRPTPTPSPSATAGARSAAPQPLLLGLGVAVAVVLLGVAAAAAIAVLGRRRLRRR
ncbi:SGNH/GDSL hydrolase family protein [Amnibacterium setariae]|nr:SGNH/GDSL hydrolase family protein [Amnibacterium setariae]